MKERPILFNGEMVRAILDGRKTQTRRSFSKKTIEGFMYSARIGEVSDFINDDFKPNDIDYILDFCPYGKIGDRLWVRETFSAMGSKDGHALPIYYRADEDDEKGWTPSIHMPRWVSRITLEITDVRVERLNDISEDDAISEGCYSNEAYCDLAGNENLWPCPSCNGWQVHGAPGSNMGWTEVDCNNCDTATKRFKSLWQSINGTESWDENPYVWCINFRRV